MEVGPGVDTTMVGRRVIVAGHGIGTYAEFVCAPALAATPIPDALSATAAAAVVMGGSVALALADRVTVSPGGTVLIEAAGTGVGGYLTQLVSNRGVRVVATAGSDANRARARELGADAVIDHRNSGWAEQLKTLLGHTTIDVLFESIGGDADHRLLDAMTPGSGHILLYGLLSGAESKISTSDLLGRGLTVTGCGGPAWLTQVAQRRAAALDMAARGELTPLIDSVLPLEAAEQAHRRIESRETTGTIVLEPREGHLRTSGGRE